MSAEVYVLADGRDVAYSNPLARYEREMLAQHIAELDGLGKQARTELGARITRSYGAAYTERLKAAYTEHRKAQKATA